MDVQTLHAADGTHVGLYFCGACKGCITKDKEWAEGCCKCNTCGAATKGQSRRCETCVAEDAGAHEMIRYAKAEKINIQDYTGAYLYDQNHSKYFSGIEELSDYYEDNDERIPHYVEACDEHQIIDLDADAIIEQELDNHGNFDDDDPVTIDDLDGVEEFRAAVKAFCEKNKDRRYSFGNENRLVILRPDDEE